MPLRDTLLLILCLSALYLLIYTVYDTPVPTSSSSRFSNPIWSLPAADPFVVEYNTLHYAINSKSGATIQVLEVDNNY